MWLFLTMLGVLAFSGYYLFSRFLLKQKDSDAVAYAIFFNIICSLLVGTVSILHGFEMPDIHTYAPNLLVMGVLYAAAQVLVFKASTLIEASEIIIISSSRIIWTIGAAILLLGESFNLTKTLGAILVLIAILLVSYERKKKKKTATKDTVKGRIYAALVGVCLGLGFVNDSLILKDSEAISYATLVFALPAIATILWYRPPVKKLQKLLTRRTAIGSTVLGIFYSIGIIASYAAYQAGGDAAQIVPIGQSVVVVTVLFSILFLKDREYMSRKLLAALIVTAGVLLLR